MFTASDSGSPVDPNAEDADEVDKEFVSLDPKKRREAATRRVSHVSLLFLVSDPVFLDWAP